MKRQRHSANCQLKHVHILDTEGNKIQLWEPID